MNHGQSTIPFLEVREETFELEVLKAKSPVLVAFLAWWSRPCHVLDSVLGEVAAVCAATVKLVKMDADNCPDVSLWYDVQSVPTLLLFSAGKVRARIVGTASKEAILHRVQTALAGGAAAPSESTGNQPAP